MNRNGSLMINHTPLWMGKDAVQRHAASKTPLRETSHTLIVGKNVPNARGELK
jgi:hypothetical protein